MTKYINAMKLTTMTRYFPTNDNNPSPAPAPRNFALGRT